MPHLPTGFDLTGRIALVTGARREIGRAIGLALAGAGADLAVHYAGPGEAEDAASVVREAEALGSRAVAFASDFLEPDAGQALARAVAAEFGRVDVLVLNASIEIVEPFSSVSGSSFERQMTVNLRATFDLLQALVPPMAERGWGRVLTIGSIQQIKPSADFFVYAGTKAAQQNWAINLARQFGGRGVTVNNLAPGAIATARNREQVAANGAAMAARIPVGRLGRPEDLSGAALLLCSDAGSFINGVDLLVDGGRAID